MHIAVIQMIQKVFISLTSKSRTKMNKYYYFTISFHALTFCVEHLQDTLKLNSHFLQKHKSPFHFPSSAYILFKRIKLLRKIRRNVKLSHISSIPYNAIKTSSDCIPSSSIFIHFFLHRSSKPKTISGPGPFDLAISKVHGLKTLKRHRME